MIAAGVRIYASHMSRSVLSIVFNVMTPLVYGSIALLLYRGDEPAGHLLQISVGAGLMGIWTSVLFGSGSAMRNLRLGGLLESLVVTPTPFSLILFPITLTTAIVGTYAMVATVIWSAVAFDVPLTFPAPLTFICSVLVCVLSMGMMGMLLASTFIFLNNANALMNALDHPIWLLSGMLVPITTLPDWLQPISWALPTTWAAKAVHDSVEYGSAFWPIVAALGVGAAYFCLSVLAIRRVERLARKKATLALT
ncbi:ABC transporter permease [Nonomuraea sp. NPDC049129]|uniref:ABC transporter permease n=1 Tax=Nonomuraea sp. NPDC049129 TaxID=3155272 RepID=UPI0033FA38B5